LTCWSSGCFLNWKFSFSAEHDEETMKHANNAEKKIPALFTPRSTDVVWLNQ